MKSNKMLIAQLKRWLRRDGNTTAGLANKLGYKTSGAVAQWISRGTVPKWQNLRLERLTK